MLNETNLFNDVCPVPGGRFAVIPVLVVPNGARPAHRFHLPMCIRQAAHQPFSTQDDNHDGQV